MGIHDEPPPQNLMKLVFVMIVAVFVTGFVIGSEVLRPMSDAPPTWRLFNGLLSGGWGVVMFSALCKWVGRR